MDLRMFICREGEERKQVDFGFAKRNERDAFELISTAVGVNLMEDDRGMPWERNKVIETLSDMDTYLKRVQYLLSCIRYELNNWGVSSDVGVYFTFQ